MRELPAPELLEIWERGSAQPSTERAVTLLRAVRPDLETETLGDMSIGQRDALLLSLREATFGRRLTSITNCPNCSEQLELGFDIRQLERGHPCPQSLETPSSHSFKADHFEMTFRLPNSRDLAVASAAVDVDSARERLPSVVSARRDGQRSKPTRCPRKFWKAWKRKCRPLMRKQTFRSNSNVRRVVAFGPSHSTFLRSSGANWTRGRSACWLKFTNWRRRMDGAKQTSSP